MSTEFNIDKEKIEHHLKELEKETYYYYTYGNERPEKISVLLFSLIIWKKYHNAI